MNDTVAAVLTHKGAEIHEVAPSTPVLDAVRQMNSERIGSLLVTENDQVVGIFSERDVLTRVVDEQRDPATTKVADVMTGEVVVVNPSMTVEEAMAVVTEKRCRHLPVVEDDRLVGLVSIGDLTQWMSRHHKNHIQDLVNYITAKYPA